MCVNLEGKEVGSRGVWEEMEAAAQTLRCQQAVRRARPAVSPGGSVVSPGGSVAEGASCGRAATSMGSGRAQRTNRRARPPGGAASSLGLAEKERPARVTRARGSQTSAGLSRAGPGPRRLGVSGPPAGGRPAGPAALVLDGHDEEEQQRGALQRGQQEEVVVQVAAVDVACRREGSCMATRRPGAGHANAAPAAAPAATLPPRGHRLCPKVRARCQGSPEGAATPTPARPHPRDAQAARGPAAGTRPAQRGSVHRPRTSCRRRRRLSIF